MALVTVRRDDGEIALTHDVALDWGQPLQPWDSYQPICLGLGDDRMLFGGLLPPGAVGVEAVEATGVRKAAPVSGGTYAVIFDDGEHGEPALGFRDAAGAFVHRPMPAEYPHRPVTDAEEPCPVCGAVQRWYANKMTLMGVTFPIYAAEGWPARINGSGSRGDDLTRLVIAHAETLPDSIFVQRPRIEITTSIDPHQPGALAVARDAFASGIEADANRQPTDGLSDAALTLWFRAARRRRVAGSYQAPVSETEIAIDGVREPFVTVGTPNARWVAVRRHYDMTITIAAREIDPASLIIEPIADPAHRLLGP